MLQSMEHLGAKQKKAYGKVLRACGLLWSKSFRCTQDISDLRDLVLDALANVEAYLPSSELDMKLHNLLHLVEKILIVGPAWVSSMFVYESLWAVLVHWATNKETPELTIMRSFADFEFAYLTLINLPDGGQMDASKQLLKELDDKTALHDLWLPARISSEELEAVVQHADFKAGFCLSGHDSSNTLLVHLHLLYLSTDDQYRMEWDDYAQYYRSNAPPTDKSRITKGKNGGYVFPSNILCPALASWCNDRGYRLWLADNNKPEPQCCIDMYAASFWRMSLGTANFIVDSHPGKKQDRQWVLANKADDNDDMFLGCIQHIIRHKGRDGIYDIIVILEWFKNVSKFDPDLLMPTFEMTPMPAHFGQAWFAKNLAPVNINMLTYPMKDPKMRVAMHRDSRFVEAAGFTCDSLLMVM